MKPGPNVAGVARTLVGGAALGVIRLFIVVTAGLTGTVFLARTLGADSWGLYSAGWSLALLFVAVVTHGVRDRLVANHDSAIHRPMALMLASFMTLIVAGWLPIALTYGSSSASRCFMGALAVWAVAYPLRLPAMVNAVQRILPAKIMILESFDAVVVPFMSLLGLLAFGPTLNAMSFGVFTAAVLGLWPAISWRSDKQQAGQLGPVLKAWWDARHLTVFQVVALSRELAIPALVLASSGTAAAGAYGIALPLGAVVTLALSAAAQPTYGAISRLGLGNPQSIQLTNTVMALLGSICAVLAPAIWVLTPIVVKLLYGNEWVYATTTISFVLLTFTLNASLVPWINLMMFDRKLNRSLLTVQGASTAVVLIAAALSEKLGGVTTVAAIFLGAQVGFGLFIAVVTKRCFGRLQVYDHAWRITSAAVATLIASLLDGPLALAMIVAPCMLILAGPAGAHTVTAWRRVITTLR